MDLQVRKLWLQVFSGTDEEGSRDCGPSQARPNAKRQDLQGPAYLDTHVGKWFRDDELTVKWLQEVSSQWHHLQVFINPAVTALPEHHHLFAEPGCFTRNPDRSFKIRNCGYDATDEVLAVESKIPDEFLPIKLDQSMDDAWTFRYYKY